MDGTVIVTLFSTRKKFEKLEKEAEVRVTGLNERQIKAISYVVKKESIGNKEYQELNKVSKRTSTLDLTDLVNRGIFRRIGKGKRKIRYTLVDKKYPKSIQKSIQKVSKKVSKKIEIENSMKSRSSRGKCKI